MPRSRRPVTLAALPLAALAAVALAACGSSASGSAAGQGADGILAQAFGTGKQVTSGKVALTVVATPSSGTGTTLTVTGPFATRGPRAVPAADLAVALESQGTTLRGGLLSTGTDAFISFGGKTYAVGPTLFKQFSAGYRGGRSASARGSASVLSALGIDPRRWLTGARLAGTAAVGGVDTDHVTAKVRLARLLADLNTLAGKAGASGLGAVTGQAAGGSLTTAQLKRTARSIRGAQVDVFVGRKDGTLRRLVVRLDVAGAAGQSVMGFAAGTVAVDLTLTEVNQTQTITAPTNALPLSALQTQLQGLFGGLGSAAPGASSKELDCVKAAGKDLAKVRACVGITG